VRARVEIHLKRGVADPEGDNVSKALRLLGFANVGRVAFVKVYEIEVEGRNVAHVRRDVEAMCQKLLANPVIHDYRIEVRK